ncbi:hypothetical protein [Pseudoclavibacter terrae]|uniref:Type IV secretion system protein n=1 Tax=Pseudoclavibacter terrae TaxID=1530195 RepID=A0A7J5AYC5_9MICO|nr:hypothetical protein [Pseudoclavibacter terrae]KAB1636061.1 hypothetical protein F8O03_17530 [Pseudoclavibacter terrae]
MANAVAEAVGKTVASLGTVWVYIGTPNITDTGDQTAVGAPPISAEIGVLLGYVTWIGMVFAIISILILGMLIATRMRAGEGIAAVGKLGYIMGGVVLISAASAIVAQVVRSGGPQGAGGATYFIQSSLWWLIGAVAVLSVIVGGIRMVWEQRGEPGRDTVKSLLTLIVVAGAGTTIVGILISAADTFAVWVLNASTDCAVDDPGGTCFGENILVLLALTTNPAAGSLGPLLIIVLGLIAVLASAFQIVLMVARGGMLVVLAGIFPLAASATNTEMGKNWFRKCVAWIVALVLYKPAAAIVYAAAFRLAGTDVFQDDGTGLLAVLTGLMLMIIALFAMPALMRFVTPMVGSMAAGAGGAALAAGALAALPSGAAALGRLSTGGGGGSKGNSGQSGQNGSTTTSPPTGGKNATPSASTSAQNAGAQNAAAGGKTGAAASSGAASTGVATSGAGAATAGAGAGAGAAAGGGAAAGATAGAAGGPVGMAAGAAAGVALGKAKEAGQAAAGAVKSVGEQSTGEGGGPDGSR